MTKISYLVLCASIALSAAGCYVSARPGYAHRHYHERHREVVVVHRY